MRWPTPAVLCALGGCSLPAQSAARSPEVPAAPVALVAAEPVGWGDTFDGALGLNDALASRQRGLAGPVSWSRLPGVWFPSAPPGEAASTVRDGRLYLLANGAVRIDRPLPPAGRHDTLRVRLDPVAGDAQSLGWCSVILQDRPDADGWVHGRASYVALLFRSHGGVELTSRGQGRALRWQGPETARREAREVVLRLAFDEGATANTVRLEGSVDGRAFQAVLDEGPGVTLPPALWAVFGAHFHPGDEPVSWIDDVQTGGALAPGG